jgi:hypothetical protein
MLAPNTAAVTAQLTSDYGVNANLMVWAHTLLNTSLYPLTPKPAWFDKIADELTAAKTKTETWLVDDYPGIAAALPQTLISYANMFEAAYRELKPLFANGNPTGASRDTALELIAALQTEARRHQWMVLGLQRKVVAFSTLVKESSARMSENAKEVKKTLGAASKDLLALQSRIAELQRTLGITTTEAKHSMNGAAMTGASLTMTMMSFTITAGIGAAAFPVFGLVGALIGIGVNAAKEASKSAEVRALIREIGELRVKVTADQFQIAALQTIEASCETLADVTVSSLTNMEGVVHHWDDIVGQLAAAHELLQQPAVDLSRVEAFRSLSSADAAWKVIATRAANIQESVLQVSAERIVLTGDAA